ncbi:MAG: hypothetical protein P4L76_11285 [Beijerinckiaceae bacterium]|nr:hypothetical protein [Beijerinckiaceae bacterium]
MARKDSNPLKIALQMREAVAYLAALASRSELEKIAHELLRVHLKLGTQIDAMMDAQRDERDRDVAFGKTAQKARALRH